MTLQTTQSADTVKKTSRRSRRAWPLGIVRQTRFQEVLHDKHWNSRLKIITALWSDPAVTLQGQAIRLAACGNGASLFIDPEASTPKAWISRCGSRLCPFCSNARSASTKDDLLELMAEHQAQRMMILTIRSTNAPLRTQIKTLLAAFRRLRQRKFWKDHVTGGARVIEITMNKRTGKWHPHLHIVYRGNYIPQKALSTVWEQITEGSNVVWVCKINNREGAAAELAKYIGKPQRIAELTDGHIRDYARSTKGLRMIQAFGDCHARPLNDSDKPDPKPPTRHRVSLSALVHLARLGHEIPTALLQLVAERWSIFRNYVWHELPLLKPVDPDADNVAAVLRVARGDRAPPLTPSTTLDSDEVLDARIAATYFTFLREAQDGLYGDTLFYHKTGTEVLDAAVCR